MDEANSHGARAENHDQEVGKARSGSCPLPRVLFVSVNPFSATSNNGKTFASFFQGYPDDCLAQLYFHRELPSGNVCSRYFRITDEDILKSLPWIRNTAGSRVQPGSTSHKTIPERAHRRLKSSLIIRALRQIAWTQVPLDEPGLEAWLHEFKPQVVMFCGGDAAALYRKVRKLGQRWGAKQVLYVTDDYVLPTRSMNPAARLMRRWTRRVFIDFAHRSQLVITIGEKMSATYADQFGIESYPVMNLVDTKPIVPEYRATDSDSCLTLIYAGSLHSNRWRVLRNLAESIQRVSDTGIRLRLLIYGPPPDGAKTLALLNYPPYCEHRGLLTPDALKRATEEADVLVHVESSDPGSMETTALSLSTKIPEYLVSGKCVLAIGPKGVASIDYLTQNGAALVVDPTDDEALDEMLTMMAKSPYQLQSTAESAYNLALRNHDGTHVRQEFWNRLREIV